jgi:AcrR family transcriptional regulator
VGPPAVDRGAPRSVDALVDDAAWVVPEGTSPPASVPPEIFAAAARAFAAGERLDMQQLAGSLGISRATLYRRAGNREQLFAAVIWSNSRATLVNAVRRTSQLRGVPRAVAVAAYVLTVSDQSVPLRRFLASDPEAALRVLTGAHGGVQERFIDAFERLLALEAARGHLALSLDLASVSYAIVRIAEGFLYADAIAERDRDIDRAVTLIDGLLRGLDTVSSSTVG